MQKSSYQTIFYLIFKLIGTVINVEVRTNRGRIDAVISLPDHIYLFEFKLDGSAQAAMEQIVADGYPKNIAWTRARRPLSVSVSTATADRCKSG